MSIIIALLATLGLTNIVVDGAIFTDVRAWLKQNLDPQVYRVFECHMCFGLWSGLFVGFIYLWLPFLHFLLYGLAGSYICMVSYLLLERLVAGTEVRWNDDEPEQE